MRKRVIVHVPPGGAVNGNTWLEGAVLRFEGDIEVDIEDLESYVQVRVLNGTVRQTRMLWTYRDPSGTLEIGDIVSVPFGFHDDLETAVVEQLGHGGYTGFIKDVESRFVQERISA